MANPAVWPRPPACSKTALDRAGRALSEVLISPDQYDLVNSWRAAHGFPLNTFQTNLRYRAKRVEPKAVVTQRLKRLVSIRAKLERRKSMRLSQIQDIGGCRAVLGTVAQVSRLTDAYLEDDLFALRDNYIEEPKEDGYRSVHLVGTYNSDDPQYAVWNGHKIEVQLRTLLQHAWATALEVVMTFTREPLKFGQGDPDWLRFFSLMGAAIAEREDTPMTMGSPGYDREELKDLTKRLRVLQRLEYWRIGMKLMPKRRMIGAETWLLVLHVKQLRLEMNPFRTLNEASAAVAKLEKDKSLDVVQVNADSLDELRSGYRNYYADTREFMTLLRRAIK
jgi:hypothetical protein